MAPCKEHLFNSAPLNSLRGCYLELTPTKGMLRKLKPGENLDRAHGVAFECPHCKKLGREKTHYVTALFHGVPLALKPEGRYAPEKIVDPIKTILTLPPLSRLSLKDWVVSRDVVDCHWRGYIKNGEVFWK